MFEGNEVKQGLSGKSVLIVGAGVAGLSAAFELEKVGHSTQILELQHRVGGRTKTLRGGFSDGLHAEGGAMRIPPNHYLTNGPAFGTSLVEYLRDELGEWWTDRLHTPVDGMDTIAKNFIKPQHTNIENTTDLAKRIKFGANVRCVKKNPENKVEVTARNVMTGTDQIYTADAVIITVPLTILRQMDIDLAEDCQSYRVTSIINHQPKWFSVQEQILGERSWSRRILKN
ncbi:MAO [Mytilus edulis]|uniref:MAO n=1 Tax=Mytilus edulis TaxID=6550 RepID=A0A8S3QFF8_MYTED|nr:MAO [Mytilus edulis]